MPRRNRAVAGLCIGIIVFAGFFPGISAFGYALIEPQWVLLPDAAPAGPCITHTPGSEQSVPLLSLLPSRAPPSSPLA